MRPVPDIHIIQNKSRYSHCGTKRVFPDRSSNSRKKEKPFLDRSFKTKTGLLLTGVLTLDQSRPDPDRSFHSGTETGLSLKGLLMVLFFTL
jgi:hypothetical protein